MIHLAIIGLFFGIIGTMSTIYFGIRALKSEKANRVLENEKIKLEKEKIELQREMITLEWDDLEIATKDLSSKIKKDFKPDIIFIPDTKDGTIVHMIRSQLSAEIPIIVGTLVWKDTPRENPDLLGCFEPFYYMLQTSKWYAFIPKGITEYKDKNVLIIDDFVLTGETCVEIKEWFSGKEFNNDKLKFACFVATKGAIQGSYAPDYYWKAIDSSDFYFPWGKGR
jgi:hypoxanthine phosphoribosyltransferase